MSNNVIWTVEAKIRPGQREAFDAVMHDLIAASQQEAGTINYEWTLGADETTVHVYERYADADAATAHLGTWGPNAERFAAAAEVTRFVVFSELTPALRDAVAGLQPVYMTPFGGFAK
ncbi:MAG: antibiotic biosynthesis monooxygenase [Deltaproteobacteria bacterium]|nr:antibiotic biosynthesis monooxygenase [Deltaproteobacteria bacterium]